MSDPFVGEIRCFGFQFAPAGWALCNGQLLPVTQNAALFAVLGTAYGGDGQSTFGLPNLQGCVPMHWGQGTSTPSSVRGETLGTTTVGLTPAQMPVHNHTVVVADAPPGTARTAAPAPGSYLTDSNGGRAYLGGAAANAPFAPAALSPFGSTANPHENMQPFLVTNFCIALQGLFPTRS